jgi:peptide deformylase
MLASSVNVQPYEIVKLGNPILRTTCEPVEDPTSPEIIEIVDRMYATIDKIGPVAGLAAPQIGINKCIFIYQVQPNRIFEGEDALPYTVAINPKLKILGSKKSMLYEGCLSFGDFRGNVPRFTEVQYSYYDTKGVLSKGLAKNFHARVLQHEMDHLHGKVYIDRMDNMLEFGYQNELAAPITDQLKNLAQHFHPSK